MMMINREENLEEVLEKLNNDWDLDEDEYNLLESVLISISKEKDISKIASLLYSFHTEDWNEILQLIPDREIAGYATHQLDLIEESDCDCDEVTLEDFNDDEIQSEYYSRFGGESTNIVENLQLEELVSNFLSADFKKREEMLKIK